MGAPGARRGLEWLLGLYFLLHISITLLMDLQVVLPRELYPVEVRTTVAPGRWSPSSGPLRAPWSCPGASIASLSSRPPRAPVLPPLSLSPPLGPARAPALPDPLSLRLPRGFLCPRPFPQTAEEKHFVPFKDSFCLTVCLRLPHPTQGQLSVFEGSSLDKPVSKSRVAFILKLCFLEDL